MSLNQSFINVEVGDKQNIDLGSNPGPLIGIPLSICLSTAGVFHPFRARARVNLDIYMYI